MWEAESFLGGSGSVHMVSGLGRGRGRGVGKAVT